MNAPYRQQSQRRPSSSAGPPPLFDPQLPLRELVDNLAEQQAQNLSNIGGSQLRRFFGEIKDLYRQFQTLVSTTPSAEARQELYAQQIEPRFKMIRSKVAYARRRQSTANVPEDFAHFLDHGIKSVESFEDFDKLVRHIEAVIGFMYGFGKVSK